MKKIFLAVGFFTLTMIPVFSQKVQNDWENEQVIGINKETAPCTYTPYSSIEQAVSEIFNNEYTRPQDMTNHTEIRWVTITNRKGNGIMVTSDSLFDYTVLHCTAKSLNSVKHPYEVELLRETVLNIEYNH